MKSENAEHIFSLFVLTFFYLFSCDFSNSLIILDTHDHCVCLSNDIALFFLWGQPYISPSIATVTWLFLNMPGWSDDFLRPISSRQGFHVTFGSSQLIRNVDGGDTKKVSGTRCPMESQIKVVDLSCVELVSCCGKALIV